MEQVTLGRSGLPASRLSFGGLFVASFAAELEQAKASLRRAVELGISYVDTAPTYGNSEEVFGHALAALGSDADALTLSTKLGGRPKPFMPQDKACLQESFDESLRLLGRDSIDLLMIHEPDRPGMYDWWTDFVNVEGPVLEFCLELRAQGKIKSIGMGGTTTSILAHLCRSGKFDVVLTAFNYSLLWQEAAEEVIPAAKEQGMGIVIGSPLQQGALARKFDTLDLPEAYWLSSARRAQFKALYKLVDDCSMSLPELALRFVISNPDIHCTLMGARSAEETELNVAAVNRGPLPADILAEIAKIYAMVPRRPYAEPFGIGWMLGNPGAWRGPGDGM